MPIGLRSWGWVTTHRGVLTTPMLSTPLSSPEWPSERALRRTASKQLFYIGLWCLLLVSRVVFVDERDGFWTATVVGWSVLIALSMVQFGGDIRAVSAWRRFPTKGDEQMSWGTSGQFILPTGGAGYGGIFGLSTTRLRYAPRWIARLRGVQAQSGRSRPSAPSASSPTTVADASAGGDGSSST